jgi:anti-sigma factor ChrR (cupin superfamily)
VWLKLTLEDTEIEMPRSDEGHETAGTRWQESGGRWRVAGGDFRLQKWRIFFVLERTSNIEKRQNA